MKTIKVPVRPKPEITPAIAAEIRRIAQEVKSS